MTVYQLRRIVQAVLGEEEKWKTETSNIIFRARNIEELGTVE